MGKEENTKEERRRNREKEMPYRTWNSSKKADDDEKTYFGRSKSSGLETSVGDKKDKYNASLPWATPVRLWSSIHCSKIAGQGQR